MWQILILPFSKTSIKVRKIHKISVNLHKPTKCYAKSGTILNKQKKKGNISALVFSSSLHMVNFEHKYQEAEKLEKSRLIGVNNICKPPIETEILDFN